MNLSREDYERLQKLEDMIPQMERQMALSETLLEKDPKLSPISAMVIAGDIQSAEFADKLLEAGEDFDSALHHVGSFSRLDWAVRQIEAGKTTERHIIDMLPELWRGSDPD